MRLSAHPAPVASFRLRCSRLRQQGRVAPLDDVGHRHPAPAGTGSGPFAPWGSAARMHRGNVRSTGPPGQTYEFQARLAFFTPSALQTLPRTKLVRPLILNDPSQERFQGPLDSYKLFCQQPHLGLELSDVGEWLKSCPKAGPKNEDGKRHHPTHSGSDTSREAQRAFQPTGRKRPVRNQLGRNFSAETSVWQSRRIYRALCADQFCPGPIPSYATL